MRAIVIAAIAALAFAGAADAKTCAKGKPCGNSCIAQSDTCHITAALHCGPNTQLCGKACIPKTKTCHK